MYLCYKTADGSTASLELKEVVRLGRSAENDLQVLDEAAAERHCEIRVVEGAATVHDLGSSSGILVDGEPVQEAMLRPGSRLQVGAVEFVFAAANGSPDVSAEVEAARARAEPDTCQNHPQLVADWRCSKCRTVFCSRCIVDGRKFGTPRVKFCPVCSSALEDAKAKRAAAAEQALSNHPLEAWRFPFRGEGLILLIGGAGFLALASVMKSVILLTGLVIVFSTGYLLAYSQKIIASTAHGEHRPPPWPDFSDFMQDILPPIWQAFVLMVLYCLPIGLARRFLPDEQLVTLLAVLGLGLLAIFLVPMAWLAVTLKDTLAALSPHFVIPSLLRLPGAYAAMVLQMTGLVLADLGLRWALRKLPVPVLPSLLSSFVSVYFLMVASRMLGMLYHRNRERLDWF